MLQRIVLCHLILGKITKNQLRNPGSLFTKLFIIKRFILDKIANCGVHETRTGKNNAWSRKVWLQGPRINSWTFRYFLVTWFSKFFFKIKSFPWVGYLILSYSWSRNYCMLMKYQMNYTLFNNRITF